MNLVIILLELFLASLAESLKDINTTPVCATLNNSYMTFPNIWEIYNKFTTTGQLWMPVSSGACSGNTGNYADCTALSPVCAVTKKKFYKTFLNKCLLEGEKKSTGTEWNVAYNGFCSINPSDGLASSQAADGPYNDDKAKSTTFNTETQNVNYNQAPAESSAAVYPIELPSSLYDTAPSTVTEDYKSAQIQQRPVGYNPDSNLKLGKSSHLQSKNPDWSDKYNHKNKSPLQKSIPLPSYNNEPATPFGHYNSMQKHTGNYKPAKIHWPSDDYNQQSNSKSGKSEHLHSQNLEWSGNPNHQNSELNKSPPAKQNPPQSYSNPPAAPSGHYNDVHKLQHSPSYNTAPSDATGHYNPSGDYNQGPNPNPGKSEYLQSQNLESPPSKQNAPPSYSNAADATGHYKPAETQWPSVNYNQDTELKPDKAEHLQAQHQEWPANYDHQNTASKPNLPPSINSAPAASSVHYNYQQKLQYSPTYNTVPSDATGHYRPSGGYNQGSYPNPGRSEYLQSQNLESPPSKQSPPPSYNNALAGPSEYYTSPPSRPVPFPSCNNETVVISENYNSAQKLQHPPSYNNAPSDPTGHNKFVQIQQPSVAYNQGTQLKPDNSAYLQSHNIGWSGNYHHQYSALNPNPPPLYNSKPVAPFPQYVSAQTPQNSPSYNTAPLITTGHNYNQGKSDNKEWPGIYNPKPHSVRPDSSPPFTGHYNYEQQVQHYPSHANAPAVAIENNKPAQKEQSSDDCNQGLAIKPDKSEYMQPPVHYDGPLSPYRYNSNKPSLPTGNYDLQYSGNNNKHNKPSSQLYDSSLSHSAKQFNPAQDPQHFKNYNEIAAPKPISSNDYAQNSSPAQFNPGLWSSVQEPQTHVYYKQNAAPNILYSSSNNAVQSMDSEHYNRAQESQTSSITAGHNPHKPAHSQSNSSGLYYVVHAPNIGNHKHLNPPAPRAPVYCNHPSTSSGCKRPQSTNSPTTVNVTNKKHTQNPQQHTITTANHKAQPSPTKETVIVIEKQQQHTTNNISVTSDTSNNAKDCHNSKESTDTNYPNAEGQTIYNGVVYQGPYHYHPKYKHINYGNYNFWPFPVLAAAEPETQNNEYHNNTSEDLLKQLQLIASKYNESGY